MISPLLTILMDLYWVYFFSKLYECKFLAQDSKFWNKLPLRRELVLWNKKVKLRMAILTSLWRRKELPKALVLNLFRLICLMIWWLKLIRESLQSLENYNLLKNSVLQKRRLKYWLFLSTSSFGNCSYQVQRLIQAYLSSRQILVFTLCCCLFQSSRVSNSSKRSLLASWDSVYCKHCKEFLSRRLRLLKSINTS